MYPYGKELFYLSVGAEYFFSGFRERPPWDMIISSHLGSIMWEILGNKVCRADNAKGDSGK